MSATDEQHERLGKGYPYTLRPELHKALRARGVDYWVAQGLTFWNCPDGRECVAYGYQSNGKPSLAVKVVGITDPEQAVAATLGRSRDGGDLMTDTEREALCKRIDELCAEVERLRKLARWAAMILTEIFPYVDYSRCMALEAVAAWKVEAYKLGIEVPDA